MLFSSESSTGMGSLLAILAMKVDHVYLMTNDD